MPKINRNILKSKSNSLEIKNSCQGSPGNTHTHKHVIFPIYPSDFEMLWMSFRFPIYQTVTESSESSSKFPAQSRAAHSTNLRDSALMETICQPSQMFQLSKKWIGGPFLGGSFHIPSKVCHFSWISFEIGFPEKKCWVVSSYLGDSNMLKLYTPNRQWNSLNMWPVTCAAWWSPMPPPYSFVLPI